MIQRPSTVSVIIPAYNVAAYIEACLDSVLAQTYTQLEILVVDDESPDNTVDIINTQYDDPRIKVIHQKNRGLSGARNTGIRQATGEFIALLDADDLWQPEKVEKHLALFESDATIGITYSQSQFMDDAGKKINLLQAPKLEDISFKDVLCRNPIGNGSAPIFRREVFADIAVLENRYGEEEAFYFDEDFRQSEDIECWIRIAATTDWKFAGIAEPLTWYRVNMGGLSANLQAQFDSWQRAIDKANGYAPALIARWGSLAKAYQYRYLARRAVRSRNRSAAVRLIGKAVWTNAKIIIEEPGRTLSTIAAAGLLAVLPKPWYEALENKVISAGQTS